MSTAPVNDQIRLLDVQALDTRHDQLQHTRRNLPELNQVTQLEKQHAQAAAAVAAQEEAAVHARREVARAETDVEQVRTRAARDQTRIDSGAVGLKDIQGLSDEIEHLNKRRAELEDVQFAAMEQVEEVEEQLAVLQTALNTAAAELAATQKLAQDALAVLDTQLADVAAERQTLVTPLDQGLVTLYEKLRQQNQGVGIGRLTGNRCEGCRMELNPMDLESIRSRAPEQVVRCEECGRILVRVPAES